MKLRIKTLDIIIILLAAGLTLFSAFSAYVKPRGQLQALIRGQDGEWLFSLDAEETVTVRGPLGDTVIQIHENRAVVKSSPCENQTCVSSGSVARQGQWAACLPNKVLLMVQGTDDDELDAYTW